MLGLTVSIDPFIGHHAEYEMRSDRGAFEPGDLHRFLPPGIASASLPIAETVPSSPDRAPLSIATIAGVRTFR
jgi:hypothetical protein